MFTYCLYHIVARFATAYIFSLKAALYYLYSMEVTLSQTPSVNVAECNHITPAV